MDTIISVLESIYLMIFIIFVIAGLIFLGARNLYKKFSAINTRPRIETEEIRIVKTGKVKTIKYFDWDRFTIDKQSNREIFGWYAKDYIAINTGAKK